MTGTKPWYMSRGIWGALIAIAAGASGAFMGREISPGDQQAMVEAAVAMAAAVGGVLALVGRIWASNQIEPIKKSPVPTEKGE